jgi:fatty-acyl-CoA synthase
MALIWTDAWEAIADTIPDQPAVIQGDRTLTWRQYEDRAARLASAFMAAGLGHDDKVGMFLYNCPEYAETQFATFKIRAVPVNVNYRYLDDELRYLLDNADCTAIVYHTSLADRIQRVKGDLPHLRLLIEVDDTGAETTVVDGAVRYDDVLANHEPAARIERSPDDVYMLYTGGTTGMPKGVMYAMGPFTSTFSGFIAAQAGIPGIDSVEQLTAIVSAMAGAGALPRALPGCPLMHGTGIWLGLMLAHLAGGAAVLLEGRSLDADELWQVVERNGVNSIVIVGDAFARPMLRALEGRAASGSPYDTSSVKMIISSGAMFAAENKAAMLEHLPGALIMDVLGSSEGGMAQSMTARGMPADTAKFALQPGTKVFDQDDQEVQPGSGVVGMVGTTSDNVPLGYYKDPEKSARTFRTIGGVRYSFPGDMATVEADGTITLLGRGSNCINTAGEKVFPEEVEEAVKTHPAVDDCLVFGVDDERFGQRVVGVASLLDGTSASADEIVAHTKGRLSSFKVPKQLVIVASVPRAPNGKADYAGAKELARPHLG